LKHSVEYNCDISVIQSFDCNTSMKDYCDLLTWSGGN